MHTMIRRLKQSVSGEHGSISLEFSFIFVVFIFFIFLIFEVCRYMYITASVDLTLAEAARISSRTENITDYNALFSQNVKEQSALLSMFITPEDFTLKVMYCSSISHAMTGNCTTGNGGKYPLAVYIAGYRYRPLLFSFDSADSTNKLVASLNNPLTRRLVYVQEYQRGDQ